MASIMMNRERPFVYIASLRRTGSTALSEALTLLPYCFIFREPNLGRDRFSMKAGDAEIFMKYGIDLLGFKEKWSGRQRKFLLDAFKKELIPQIGSHIAQIGVKEIRHEGWRKYLKQFPEMKVLLTARDPRDIYISLHYRVKSGKGKWTGEYSAERVVEDLKREFGYQKEMFGKADCLKVRYEDLCKNPSVIDNVRRFICSKAPSIGMIGAFNAKNPNRIEEFEVHGNSITQKRINRWRWEMDKALVAEAQKVFSLMCEYNEFWGYLE